MLNIELLKKQTIDFGFREKRPNIYKVLVPFFHEDGDMYDIFVEESPVNNNLIRVSDYGLTLMKLSYAFDIDTDNKRTTLESIVAQNRCEIDNGLIYIDVLDTQVQSAVFLLSQVISKVSNMDIISREMVKSMFYDLLQEFVLEMEISFNYKMKKDITPLADSPDLVVDFEIPAKRPIYLFGARDDSKASKIIISCLQFSSNKLPYQSLVIHEDFETLTKFNQKQITNAVDKQYTSLDEFKAKGRDYLARAV
ncbi:MAG: DUF1828 domain-containing protein [Ignavibacteria bacterium]|jgi:hypothetical protein|nr:DUF1828 domain-containing protein [Ignavibacteria bacterium]